MITSGLRKTFIRRYIVERSNKAEWRPEEQSEKAESCRENLRNDVLFKGPYRHRHRNSILKQCGKTYSIEAQPNLSTIPWPIIEREKKKKKTKQ